MAKKVERRGKYDEDFPICERLKEAGSRESDVDFIHGLAVWFQTYYLDRRVANRLDRVARRLEHGK